MEKIVSVAKARQTLGKLSDALTDDQVRDFINMLKLLANEQVSYNGSKVDESSDEPRDSTKI